MAISPLKPENSEKVIESNKLSFPLLVDPGLQVASRYGLTHALPTYLRPVYQKFGIDLEEANGDSSWELPLTATYVIDTGGVIRWTHLNGDYTTRAEPADVIAALDALE